MKMNNRELDNILDDVTAEIRDERLDAAVVAGAAQRVRMRLDGEQAAVATGIRPVEQLRDCDDFQSLIPNYLAGELSAARTMLFEDHTRECVPCRKALKVARHGNHAVQQLEEQKAKVFVANRRMATVRWAMAAAVILGVGLVAWPYVQRLTRSLGTLSAVVEAANGSLYKVTSDGVQTMKIGQKLERGERLRTARGGSAVVKLADGSKVEMNERAEVSLSDNGAGTTINLERGQVIVQAAKQHDKHLFVATDDSLVSVTGTIFSVNSGTKGSRVSVVEGEVQVNHAGKRDVLNAGQQVTTHESIERTPVRGEVAWSRDAERYGKLLDSVRAEIDAAAALPGNRYSTKLLDLMPENTVLYVAIPNISATLVQANQILQENLAKNPQLNAWYEKEQGQTGREFGMQQAIKQVSEFGRYLGQEIAIGAEPDAVLVLAEVNDAAGLRAHLEQQLNELGAKANHKLPVQFVADPLTSTLPSKARDDGDDPKHLLIWMRGDTLAAATELVTLQKLAANAKSNAAEGFAASDFRAKLADVYRDGAGFVIAADLEKIVGKTLIDEPKNERRKERSAQAHERETAALSQLGVTDLRYFIVELKEKDGKPFNRASVSFKETNHGITSWLAAPNPMGALEFISPDANVVAAFVVKEPTALVDDLLGTLKTADPKAWEELQKFQQEQGLDIRNDIAAPLGGEYAFAIDGPVVPIPSWKAIVQVDDQARLQQTLELTVQKLNEALAKDGKKGLTWARSMSGGRTFYTLKSLDVSLIEVNYTYAYGYLIAAPSRALVESAIKYKESGVTLLQSAKFKATLPEDKQANFSALVYQNLESVTKAASGVMKSVGGAKEATSMINGMFGKKAALAYAYALDDRMIFSVNNEDGPLGVRASDLLGLPGSSGLGGLIGRHLHQ